MEGYILYIVLSYLIMIGYVLSYVHDNRGNGLNVHSNYFCLYYFLQYHFHLL